MSRRRLLWNTLAFVAKLSLLVDLGRDRLPDTAAQIARIAARVDVDGPDDAVAAAFASLPSYDFSRSVLAASLPGLAVSRLSGVLWSDLGSPDRVLRLLQRCGSAPVDDGVARGQEAAARKAAAEG